MPWETTEQYIRSGHGKAGALDSKSMRTITISEGKGIKAIVGCKKGGYVGGRCRTGMVTQSYLFEKKKGWTMARAKAWFKSHKAKKKKEEVGAEIFEEVKKLFNRMDRPEGWYDRPGQKVIQTEPVRGITLKSEGAQAFCVKCRKKVTIKNPKTSGKKTTGVCPTCGTKVTSFGGGK